MTDPDLTRKIEKVVLLTSRASFPGRFVLFGKARLLSDRLLFSGFRFSRTIPMDDIQGVGWSGKTVTIELTDGEIVEFNVTAPGTWKFAIQDRCGMTSGRWSPVDKLDEKDSSAA